MRTGRHEFAIAIAALAVSLSACTTGPATQLSWNVRDYAAPKYKARVQYGPSAVKLPPVEQHRFVPPSQNTEQRYAAWSTPKTRKTPGWYVQSLPAPQPAPRNVVVQPDRVADASLQFRWPLAGRVISDFGASGTGERNDGINISAQQGEPVRASASGTVSDCGNELKGYGNLVLVRHRHGFVTAYGRADKPTVKLGDHVRRGQAIARSGRGGEGGEPQLHFEIRKGATPVDPAQFLPPG